MLLYISQDIKVIEMLRKLRGAEQMSYNEHFIHSIFPGFLSAKQLGQIKKFLNFFFMQNIFRLFLWLLYLPK